MTHLNPHRAQPSDLRAWRLYRVWRADGRLLYVGQSCRGLARLIEHLYEQAWAHEICRWELDPRAFSSEAEVLVAETAAIRAEKPLRNWTDNAGEHRQWQPKVTSYRHPGRRQKVSSPPPLGEVLRAWVAWWCRRWWRQLRHRW